jgi:hypothetical protein
MVTDDKYPYQIHRDYYGWFMVFIHGLYKDKFQHCDDAVACIEQHKCASEGIRPVVAGGNGAAVGMP